jgi:hypothetical protein
VRAAQIERRLRMIKTNVGPGPIFSVAIGAPLTEPLHVRLCVAMTRNALHGRFSERLALHMTRAAIATDMAAAQRKIGSIVIERRTLQTHDVGVATLMLGVTGLAEQLRLVFGDAPMETRQRRHVGTNFLVTIHAERRLLGRYERAMAVRTIVFQIGVPVDDRTGHDQSLETCSKGQPRHEQRQYQHDVCPVLHSHD